MSLNGLPRLTPVRQNWRNGHAGHAPEADAAEFREVWLASSPPARDVDVYNAASGE
jgi:hypothetical protein